MPDNPTTTHTHTTASVPEWTEAATGDARDAEIALLRRTIETMRWHRDERDKQFRAFAKEFAEQMDLTAARESELDDVKAECCRLVCRNGDLEAEVVSLGQVSAAATEVRSEYRAAKLDTVSLRRAMDSLDDALDKLSAKPAAEPEWLVEETTLYTLNERGVNRIYATFHGKGEETYAERCELAKRCRDALNSHEHAKEQS